MVFVRAKVRVERKRGPGAAAGVELERSFEKKGSGVEKRWQKEHFIEGTGWKSWSKDLC